MMPPLLNVWMEHIQKNSSKTENQLTSDRINREIARPVSERVVDLSVQPNISIASLYLDDVREGRDLKRIIHKISVS